MKKTIPEIIYKRRKLIAIPAVHYRAAFAKHVKSVCSNQDSRPGAIAVELGPGATSAISAWFKELETATSGGRIPSMLGLIRNNRRIHPQFKEKAIRLQKNYAKQLHEIPQSILKNNIDYAAVSLVCLSLTDSIIEAIRCAHELKIPVYGIDIEDSASMKRSPGIIEDPLKAYDNLGNYIHDNQHPAMTGRDHHVDGRREKVMAARLKYLLLRHERILFTGGLAHWLEIQRLLTDSCLKPASHIPINKGEDYTRVLVHPAIAVSQMDIFPSVTTWYEKQRKRVNPCSGSCVSTAFMKMFHEQLDAAYIAYFSDQNNGKNTIGKCKDREKLPAFESFLGKLCVMTQHQFPTIAMVMEAAEAIMSNSFVKSLSESLIKHDMKWAMPDDFKELPLLGPAPAARDHAFPSSMQTARVGVPRKGRGADDDVIYEYTDPFYLSAGRENGDSMKIIKASWFTSDKPDLRSSVGLASAGLRWAWPPCEFLLHATGFEAANLSKSNSSERNSEAFEGSLLEGINVKKTLRAKIRGDNTLYVHRKRKNMVEDNAITNGQSLEPTVFIFEDPNTAHKAVWSLGTAGGDDMREYVKPAECARFDKITGQFGSVFVGSVFFASRVPSSEDIGSAVEWENKLFGYLSFGNPCANINQSLMWLEATDYRACPILRDKTFDNLVGHYQLRHNVSIEPLRWAAALVRFAIPYARKRVVIVAADGFALDRIAQQEAHARRIELDVIPLSVFPRDTIRQTRRQYFVKTGKGGLEIELELERQLGPKDKYLDMLPPMMQAQVMSNP